MSKEHVHEVSERAVKNRMWLAESPISNYLFPIEHTDPYRTMDRLCDHLESGESAVVISTHPSIEDIGRAGKFLMQWPAIRHGRIVGPAAVHWMPIVKPLTKPFELEGVPVVTQHSLDRKTYDRRTQAKYLEEYAQLIVKSLSQNSLLVATSQADQMPTLDPPTMPVIDFILKRIQRAGITNVLFVPMGIEIKGLEDYSHARKLSLKRYPYIFHVGPAHMDQEIRDLSKEQGISSDFWFYKQLLPLVPPQYRSKQSDLS